MRADRAAYRRLLGDDRAWRLLRPTLHAVRHFAAANLDRGPLFDSWPALMAYLRAELAVEPVEQFRCLLLDSGNRLIRDELISQGSIDECHVDVRRVLIRALDAHAAAIVLVHNHPSGDPTPSLADRALTRRLAQAAGHLGLAVHDHIIVGRAGHVSFRAEGLL